MSKRLDLQIFWVVLFALAFWALVWQHEMVMRVFHRVYNVVAAFL